MKVMGLAGWSGSGKTTLLVKLLPLLVARGLRIATVKHADHQFDIDQPGKDSYEQRKAGASEVIISSARRWALMHELGADPEPTLAQLLRRLTPCDIVLVEGFKAQKHPKIEIFRRAIGKSPLYPGDPRILAIASDCAIPGAPIPVVDLNDVQAVETLVLDRAEALQRVLPGLEDA